MSAFVIVFMLSAMVGFAFGISFSYSALAVSGVAFALLSAAVLHIQGFGALPGIATIVACLAASSVIWPVCSLFIAAWRFYSKNRPTRNHAALATTMLITSNSSNKGSHLRTADNYATYSNTWRDRSHAVSDMRAMTVGEVNSGWEGSCPSGRRQPTGLA
jgi:hypothetical protein